MLHGVRFDLAMAKTKAIELNERKNTIKAELLNLTDGFKLWSEASHLTLEVKRLLEAARLKKAQYDAIDKKDRAARKAFKPELDATKEAIKACRSIGRDKFVEIGTGLSDDKIAKYLYEHLKLPAAKKRRKDSSKVTVTVDEIALKKLRQKYSRYSGLIQLILEHRKCNKLLSYLDASKVDKDGRIRCQYKPFGTQSGRLSSSENPLGTGTNLQNLDRSLKTVLLPDEG
ncbi:MAG: hypothetical protein KGJ90_03945 [Patescibacteria group bacterium]|nr:hypothetical protein [Patescibacteria group bacterium]